MKKILLLVIVVLTFVSANAQEKELPKFKLIATGSASEVSINNLLTVYSPTVGGEATVTLGTIGKHVRISAGALYKRNLESEVNTVHGIGRLSAHFGAFEPFADFSAGADIDNFSNRQFSREAGFGIDINSGFLTFRPFRVGFKRVGNVGFLQGTAERTYSAGFGVNF